MNRDDDVFADALEIPEAERAAFLDRACAGDPAMRARVEALLRGHAQAPTFFELAPAGSPPAEKTDDLIGRYRLRECIGEGGCGVVWLAEQTEPVRRRVALKIIKLGMDTREVIARFEAERQALALMDHPNIARVFDAGTTASGRPYFVMELVRGIPITRYCDGANLPTEARLKLFIDVCHAIQHAHQKGIIHRDIKPSNILVAQYDDVAVPKVIDFGIAKATQGRLTDSTIYTAFAQFIGTPAYMSPEQAEFNALDVDTRSDIYSLGVLLYELLTGRPPFDPKSLQQAGLDEIRRIIREVEPPRPSTRLNTLNDAERTTLAKLHGAAPAQLSTQLSGDLDWIVMKALEKNRTRRYETANGFALDLQRHLRHEPVIARPPSQAYLLQKLVRRHRLAFGASAAIAAVLVLGATVSTWQAIRAKAAEQIAMQSEQEQRRLRETAQNARAAEFTLRQSAEAQKLAVRHLAYASDMNLLQQALADENRGRALALLNRQRPQPGETDLRDWEWRYLWQFCQSEAKSVLVKRRNNFSAIAASPDGTWLAAGPTPIMIWNLPAETREEIPVRGVTHVAFSPREPLLAMAGFRESPTRITQVVLWNLATRQTVREWTFSTTGDDCTGLFFSEDGQTLVTSTASAKNEIGLWRVATGEKLRSFPTEPTEGQARYAFFAVSRDLKLAAYVSRGDYHVHVRDLETGRELWSKSTGAEWITALAFSPDGKVLASGEAVQSSSIRLWDAVTGIELGRMEGHRRAVNQLVFWPDGKTLASASGDQTVRLWDVATRRQLRVLRGHTLEAHSLALLPDNKTLASGSKNGELLLWDTTTPTPTTCAVTTIPGEFDVWRFSDDGRSIVTVGRHGQVGARRGENFQNETTLLNLDTKGGVEIWTAGSIHIGESDWTPATRGATLLAEDSSRLAYVPANGNIEVWDWERGERVSVIAANQGAEWLAPLSFADKGGTLLLIRFVRGVGVTREEWDLATGRQTRSWKPLNANPGIRAELPVALSPDQRRFISVVGQAALVRTDLDTSSTTRLELDLSNNGPRGNFSPDSSLFAAPTWNGLVQVVKVDPLRSVTTLSGVFGAFNSAVFSPDGHRLATGSGGREAMLLWDVGSYERVLTLEGAGYIRQAAFSPDGNILGAIGGVPPRSSLHFWRAPTWAEIAAAEVLTAPKP